MAQNYDFIIVITGSKIKDYPKKNDKYQADPHIAALLENDQENIDPVGILIDFTFCAYDLQNKMVQNGHEGNFMIKYENLNVVQNQLDSCRIAKEKYDADSVFLKEALQKLNDFLYTNFIREGKNFCFMSFGDDLLTKILPQAVKKVNDIKLAPHFYQYFDILSEFKKHLPHAVQLYTLQEMLAYTNLKNKENSFEPFSTSTCKNVVRLLNMLINEGHILQNPKMINSSFQSVIDTNDDKNVYIAQRQIKSRKNYVRARTPSPFKNPTRGYYLRLRGLPYNSTEFEVFEFMRGIRLYKEDIAFNYDGEGKFTGEVYLRLSCQSDKYEAQNLNLGELEENYIEIYDTTENEWNQARMSQFSDKNDKYDLNAQPTNSDTRVSEDQGIIKLKGISANTTEQDIITLFVGLQVQQIRRSVIGGKPGNECFVVFKSKQEAHQALTYHMERINHRFVEVTLSNIVEFSNFMAHNFQSSAPQYSKDNMPIIPNEKKPNTLLVTGLSFNVTKEQIVAFFNEYSIQDRDIYMLTSHSGKFSGNCLVTFEDELEAQRALKQKNFTYLGSRYIEMFQYK
ncbi:hypothetical protein PPERSA_07081 [Pseudocohnilembus persalinus]|uniref:RRM domain-containing protein n=1 Tax=Pseudocohnilembus persalinus TaxID=266149 RepID=A0A0V0QXG3_PSEPJ|nr:hypothetical protein PPERSA_07081 [Pseudocohnilembus persalinus]|eukprot:KRX06918.1 hypothetical protein PPERSA_07081 [Pseudocohnilembus persalinus]